MAEWTAEAVKRMDTGLIHIYCGDGKGKTSAAVGQAVRAAGRGMRILFVRFLKHEDSGEVPILRQIPGIEVTPCDREFGFIFKMDDAGRAQASAYFSERFRQAVRRAVEGGFDLLVLDELVGCCSLGMVPEAEVLTFLQNRPRLLEVILTGRDPSEALIGLADYVSEVRMGKHPFTRGIAARRGIEY